MKKEQKAKATKPAANYFRHLRIYDEQSYNEFTELCHKRGSNATREINFLIGDSVRKGKIPTDSAVIL